MPVTTNVSNLVINKMTKQQYSGITPSDTELYFVVDDADYVQFTAVDDSVAPPISIAGGGTGATTTSQAIINLGIYPIGSIYLSTSSSFSPSAAFGGTWERIKDTFLLAAGDTYANGSTGGEATVKLDLSNYWYSVWNAGRTMPSTDVNSAFNGGSELGIQIKYSENINVPHNNMPPYLTVYMWKRTA